VKLEQVEAQPSFNNGTAGTTHIPGAPPAAVSSNSTKSPQELAAIEAWVLFSKTDSLFVSKLRPPLTHSVNNQINEVKWSNKGRGNG
jgi:hypothetical protein